MDADRIRGTGRTMSGSIKEAAGKIIGNTWNAIGGAKDSMHEKLKD